MIHVSDIPRACLVHTNDEEFLGPLQSRLHALFPLHTNHELTSFVEAFLHCRVAWCDAIVSGTKHGLSHHWHSYQFESLTSSFADYAESHWARLNEAEQNLKTLLRTIRKSSLSSKLDLSKLEACLASAEDTQADIGETLSRVRSVLDMYRGKIAIRDSKMSIEMPKRRLKRASASNY